MADFETLHADWLSPEDAVRRILDAATPLPAETVPLADALGRPLAEDLIAPVRLPSWDSSAMDGYAVRAEDVRGASEEAPVTLRVTGHVAAGPSGGVVLEPGSAVRIMTGGEVPEGADSVVRVEHTDRERTEDGTVRVLSDADAGRHVRPGGLDCSPGDVMLRRGEALTPGAIAVAASLGRSTVSVGARPTVALLANGDELAAIDDYQRVIDGAAVPEANSHGLSAAAAGAGALPLPLGIARDDAEDLKAHLLRAMDADVLVTIAGASMGQGDLVKRVLADLGYELDFWRVRIRPGSPLSFGHLPRRGAPPLPVFGLPGNPASAFVTFDLFVRPFLLRLAGHHAVHRLAVEAVADEALPSTPDLTHFVRVTLVDKEGRLAARLTGPQGSGLISSLGAARGLAILPEGVGTIAEGDAVQVILLDDRPAWKAEPPPLSHS